jgi:hypothetical protein
LHVAKILFNGLVSTHGAKFMTKDISNFYLMTPLKWPDYIHVKIDNIPEEIIIKYKLYDIVEKDGSIYIMASGIYGLPQAVLLITEQHLNEHATNKATLFQGFGNTTGDQSNSSCS